MIGRRAFITLLGGAAAARPLAASAQQATRTLIGYLSLGTPAGDADFIAGFRKGLSEMGFAETRNIAIEFRWAQNDFNRLPEMAADLVRKPVVVIAAVGTAAPLAAKARTDTIPIVFTAAADPVQSGLVTSLNRPGGNVTGISTMSEELGPKRLGLLHQLLRRAERFALLTNPGSSQDQEIADLRAAATTIGRRSRPYMPAPMPKSMRLLPVLCKSEPKRFWSASNFYLLTVARKLSHSQRATLCL